MSDDVRRDWVKRVLGVDVGAAGTGSVSAGPLLPIWNDAKERVDAGIGKLQVALREAEDEDLEQIAEFGLYGATRGQSVALMVALREVDSAPSPASHNKLRVALDNYRDFLEGAPIVELIEDNPFGVNVPLRATLGAALDEMERRIPA